MICTNMMLRYKLIGLFAFVVGEDRERPVCDCRSWMTRLPVCPAARRLLGVWCVCQCVSIVEPVRHCVFLLINLVVTVLFNMLFVLYCLNCCFHVTTASSQCLLSSLSSKVNPCRRCVRSACVEDVLCAMCGCR